MHYRVFLLHGRRHEPVGICVHGDRPVAAELAAEILQAPPEQIRLVGSDHPAVNS